MTCNLTTASSKQRQENNNLATFRRAKPKGARDHSNTLHFVKSLEIKCKA